MPLDGSANPAKFANTFASSCGQKESIKGHCECLTQRVSLLSVSPSASQYLSNSSRRLSFGRSFQSGRWKIINGFCGIQIGAFAARVRQSMLDARCSMLDTRIDRANKSRTFCLLFSKCLFLIHKRFTSQRHSKTLRLFQLTSQPVSSCTQIGL